MAKTGKGLPRSLQNVDFGDFDIPVTPATTSVVGGVKKVSYCSRPRGHYRCRRVAVRCGPD